MNEASWSDVQMEDTLGLEVGYRLIPMVDHEQQGQLLTRVRGIRKKFAQQMGFLPPAVHIRDNLDLAPTHYRILLKGVTIGSGEVQPDRWMAINPGCAEGEVPGTPCTEPTFGLPALWIDEVHRELAQTLGYTVVDPSSVVATHLNHLITTHTEELFGRQEAQQLLDQITKHSPKLVEDLIPAVISLTTLHKVLQNLLAERVPIRDMRTIIDTLAEFATAQSDADELTTRVRARLSRAITQQWFPGEEDIQLIGLDLSLEQLLIQATQSGSAIEPGIAENLMKQTEKALQHQEGLGAPPVLLVNPALRLMLSRYLRRIFPQLAVLSSQEINTQRNVRMTYLIGGKDDESSACAASGVAAGCRGGRFLERRELWRHADPGANGTEKQTGAKPLTPARWRSGLARVLEDSDRRPDPRRVSHSPVQHHPLPEAARLCRGAAPACRDTSRRAVSF